MFLFELLVYAWYNSQLSYCNVSSQSAVMKKKMKMKLFVASVAFVLSLFGCSKTSSNNDEVFIRVENATSDNFSNFTLNGTDFGSITSGDTTSYRQFKNVWPYPFANEIAINNSYLYIIDIVP